MLTFARDIRVGTRKNELLNKIIRSLGSSVRRLLKNRLCLCQIGLYFHALVTPTTNPTKFLREDLLFIKCRCDFVALLIDKVWYYDITSILLHVL